MVSLLKGGRAWCDGKIACFHAGGKDTALVLQVPVTLASNGVLSLIFFGTTDQATVAGAPLSSRQIWKKNEN
jgi:hypothetical protein